MSNVTALDSLTSIGKILYGAVKEQIVKPAKEVAEAVVVKPVEDTVKSIASLRAVAKKEQLTRRVVLKQRVDKKGSPKLTGGLVACEKPVHFEKDEQVKEFKKAWLQNKCGIKKPSDEQANKLKGKPYMEKVEMGDKKYLIPSTSPDWKCPPVQVKVEKECPPAETGLVTLVFNPPQITAGKTAEILAPWKAGDNISGKTFKFEPVGTSGLLASETTVNAKNEISFSLRAVGKEGLYSIYLRSDDKSKVGRGEIRVINGGGHDVDWRRNCLTSGGKEIVAVLWETKKWKNCKCPDKKVATKRSKGKCVGLSGGKKGPCDKYKDQLSKKERKDCNTKCKPIRNKTQQKKCVARYL